MAARLVEVLPHVCGLQVEREVGCVLDGAATGIDVVDGQIRAVETAGGRIETSSVVCAAGAWSAQVGDWAWVALPVTPLRRQVLITEPVPGLNPSTPFTIDFDTSLYFHREGRGALVGHVRRG